MACSRVNLDTLPAELILKVLDYLPIQALRSLNLTNRHFYNISLNNLYATSPGLNEQLLLRTITRPGNAELARRVKKVVCGLYTKPHLRRVPLEEGRAIVEAFQALPLSVSDDKKTELANNFETKHLNGEPGSHEYFEFFLLFLPNLESLEIHDAWQWDDHTFWFTAIAENTSRFGHLKNVTIHGPLRIENVVLLMTLPTMKTLELWRVMDTRRAVGETFDWEYPGQSISEKLSPGCNLETLALYESYVPTCMLLPIVRAIRGLKSFTYEHRSTVLMVPGSIYTNIEVLSRCIALQATTLQHLAILDENAISGDEWLEYLAPRTENRRNKTNLPVLNALKSLSIAPIFLKDLIRELAHFSDDKITVMSRFASSVVVRLPSTLQTLKILFLEKPDEADTMCALFLSCFVEALTLTEFRGLRTVQIGSSHIGSSHIGSSHIGSSHIGSSLFESSEDGSSSNAEMLNAAEVHQLKQAFEKLGVEFVYEPGDLGGGESSGEEA
jgi:hypothetical protein